MDERRAGPTREPPVDEEDGRGGFIFGGRGLCGGLHDDGAETGDGPDERVGKGGGGLDAQELGVELGGALEVEVGGGAFAVGGELGEEGLAVGGEEGLDRGGLGGVGGRALGRAGLVAWREALVHLTVDAAGMLGIRREVLVAAAELEEVEDGVAVAVGGGARREGAVGVGERAAAETVGGVDARKGVLGGEAQEEGRVQTQAAAGFGLRKDADGRVVESERGLELGAGDGEVDAGNAVAKVEALGLRVGRREDAGDAAAEVGGAGEVRLGWRLTCAAGGPCRAKTPGSAGMARRISAALSGEKAMECSKWKARPQEDCRWTRRFDVKRIPPASVRNFKENPLWDLVRITLQLPAMVMPSMRRVGAAVAVRKTRSLPMAEMFLYISLRLPAMVISSTG